MRVTRLDAHGAKIFHRVVIPIPTFFFVFLKNYGFTQDARETEKGVYAGGSDHSIGFLHVLYIIPIQGNFLARGLSIYFPGVFACRARADEIELRIEPRKFRQIA